MRLLDRLRSRSRGAFVPDPALADEHARLDRLAATFEERYPHRFEIEQSAPMRELLAADRDAQARLSVAAI